MQLRDFCDNNVDESIVEVTVLSYLCSTGKFIIKGKQASESDFGHGKDIDPGRDETGYGCGNMQFISYDCGSEEAEHAKATYDLSDSEYIFICRKLEELLSFGPCEWCV
jgi:hypothetical protein